MRQGLKMLDLNVDVAVSVADTGCNFDRSGIETESYVQEDHRSEILSGTSVSSDVSNVNADEDDHPVAVDVEVDDEDVVSYSGDDKRSFRIDIFGEKRESTENSQRSSVSLITRQFFPVAGYLELEEELGSQLISPSPSAISIHGADWLNLKVPESEPKSQNLQPAPAQKARKSRRGPPSRSSQYRGVTFYRRTGRWESHIWDSGKQLYLGGFDTSHAAARAYDRAAIKFRGPDADINFDLSDYDEDMIQMNNLSKEEFIHILRRQSNGFSRGSSRYRGVTLHKCGRWEARMGQLLGKKAYDKAAIKVNGREAVTNFEPSSYGVDMNSKGKGEASGYNLDLSLWVSPTIDCKVNHVQNMNMGGFTACELPSGKRPKVGGLSPTSTPGQSCHDLTDTAQHFSEGPRMYSGHTPNYKEMTKGVSNEAWQMQMVIGHHVVAPNPVASTAASSGFSSSVTKFTDPLFFSNTNMQNKASYHY